MSKPLLDYYKAIENGSRKMLEAAQADDWDEVVRFESACAVLIEQLREHSRNAELEPHQRGEKAQIMQRILRIDAQMRVLAEPWMAQMDQLYMHPAAQSQMLH
jgi:flagellar protein FliT